MNPLSKPAIATAFIPAKSRSTRIPRKNTVDLGGRPLVEWTLEACRRWKTVGEIFVATDDDQIAAIAAKYEALVYPLDERDVSDQRTVSQLWQAFLRDRAGPQILMHATNPFRFTRELEAAWEMFASGQFDIVISVQAEHRLLLDENGKPEIDAASRMSRLSQHSKRKYLIDGSFYIADAHYAANCRHFEEGRVGLFPISRIGAIEIDTPEDLELARLIAKSGFNAWE